MFGFRKPAPPGWLVVFLGNPGKQYEATRHNVGWLVCDVLADQLGTPVRQVKHRALTGRAVLQNSSLLLLKPTTYMNLSGEAVADAAGFYKLPPERILVVTDDTALPAGRLRLRMSGSAGGHNGLKSIIQHLGTDRFPRLRIGVGAKPHPDYDLADWVLGRFPPEDQKIIDAAVKLAAEAIECAVTAGMDEAMSRFNKG